MKNKVLKVICFLFAVIMLIATVPMSVLAASDSTLDNPMRNTYIIDDLENLGFDIDAYKRDENAKFYDVLHLYEFAYPYKSCDQRFYSLFLYVYNPSGEPIDVNNKNRVSLSYWGVDGSVFTKNLDMVCVGYSYRDGYEHLFYKFQITGTPAIKAVVNPTERQYRVNSIEINYKDGGVNKLKDYSIGDHYYCKGYQEYYGYEETKIKFDCYKKETDVIPVEIKSASWFSENWAGAESDYRYEMTSVYFTIPDHFVKKYGNPGEKEYNTSGLEEVHGEYYKYVTDGLVVNDKEFYDKYYFSQYSGLTLSDKDRYSDGTLGNYSVGFYNTYKVESSGYAHTWNNLFTYNMKLGVINDNIFNYQIFTSDDAFNHVCNFLLSDNDNFYVSSEDFLKYYQQERNHYGDTGGLWSGNANIFTGLGYQPYQISVNDESLNSKLIKKYKQSWWNEFTGKGTEINYDDIRPLIEISFSDISSTKTDEAIAENLFIGVDDVKSLKSFYNEYDSNNHIYLMRFDVNPYYATDVVVTVTPEDPFKTEYARDGVYFEKVVYENFDILTFKFVNESGNSRTVPVSMSPIDIVGGVVGPNVKDPNNPNNDDGDDSMDWMKKLWEWFKDLKVGYKILAVVLLFVIVFAVIVLISKITKISINAIFKGVGWLIAAPFKLVGKGVSAAKTVITGKRKSKEKSKNKEKKE